MNTLAPSPAPAVGLPPAASAALLSDVAGAAASRGPVCRASITVGVRKALRDARARLADLDRQAAAVRAEAGRLDAWLGREFPNRREQ